MRSLLLVVYLGCGRVAFDPLTQSDAATDAPTPVCWDLWEGTVPAFGMYVSGDYQFARRWFAGARYDWSERATDASLTDKGASVTLTFWPSEFSQLRGQYRRIYFAEGVNSNELLFQLLFSIGAHGAHVF